MTKGRKKRWIDSTVILDRLYEEYDGSIVFDKHHYVKVRKDILPSVKATGISSIPVYNAGALMARLEATAQLGKNPQPLRAEKVLRLGIASGGLLLCPSFTTYSRVDARVSQRFYREEDLKNWSAFYIFTERAMLQAETAKRISELGEPIQGLMLYHLWINADLTLNRESPPERYTWS